MPIFEYFRRQCSGRFEAILFGAESPVCPHCGSRDPQKLLSTFAAGGEGGREEPSATTGPCGTCGDPCGLGSCSLN